jgi:hypothetical protein
MARTHVFLVGLGVGDCSLHVGQRQHEAAGEHLGFDIGILAGEETEALPDRGGMVCKLAPDDLADTPAASPAPSSWRSNMPTRETLAARFAACWLPDEVIIYIGLWSRSLRERVREYYV